MTTSKPSDVIHVNDPAVVERLKAEGPEYLEREVERLVRTASVIGVDAVVVGAILMCQVRLLQSEERRAA